MTSSHVYASRNGGDISCSLQPYSPDQDGRRGGMGVMMGLAGTRCHREGPKSDNRVRPLDVTPT